jgi:hypothetical protein
MLEPVIVTVDLDTDSDGFVSRYQEILNKIANNLNSKRRKVHYIQLCKDFLFYSHIPSKYPVDYASNGIIQRYPSRESCSYSRNGKKFTEWSITRI